MYLSFVYQSKDVSQCVEESKSVERAAEAKMDAKGKNFLSTLNFVYKIFQIT